MGERLSAPQGAKLEIKKEQRVLPRSLPKTCVIPDEQPLDSLDVDQQMQRYDQQYVALNMIRG